MEVLKNVQFGHLDKVFIKTRVLIALFYLLGYISDVKRRGTAPVGVWLAAPCYTQCQLVADTCTSPPGWW